MKLLGIGFSGDSPVERESKSGNRTLFLGQSATPEPGLFEVRPSTSPNRSAETRPDELSIRISRTEGLPPANTRRWVIRRKAAVVGAVRSGAISLQDACRRYQLSEEEFLSWERALATHGLAGLRVTRVQQYRLPRVDTSQTRSKRR